MLETLMLLALTLSHGHAYARALGASTMVVNVVVKADTSILYPELTKEDPWAARTRLGRLFVAWSYYESSWEPKARGDNGTSCGIMQMKPWYVGKTCKELENPHVAYEASLKFLERLTKQCGTLRSALGAYASGKCDGAPTLVAKRCQISEGC